MADEIENPPAFPLPATEQHFHNQAPMDAQTGMTLRDYFAAKAMAAIISRSECRNWQSWSIPKEAYQIADAMLKARKETTNG